MWHKEAVLLDENAAMAFLPKGSCIKSRVIKLEIIP